MVHHRLLAPTTVLDFASIRHDLEIPGPFPNEVLEAAGAAAGSGPLDPAGWGASGDRIDATDLPLVTIDPPGSTDLDQAVAIEDRPEGGWRVRYAIADVSVWVEPGGAIDTAARVRTQTYDAPDTRIPLHPPALGEAAASLLPDGPRPAVLWSIDVAPDGSTTHIDLARATIRSRAQLTYEEVQDQLDAGTAAASLGSFPALGAARRLVDRFATEVCLATVAGTGVPAWAHEALTSLPDLMSGGDHLAHQLDRAVVDTTEAFVLTGRIREEFAADVVESGERYGTVALADPAIRARCDGAGLPLGGKVRVRCTKADVDTRTVRFAVATGGERP